MGITCPECGRILKRVNFMHISTHGFTLEEFDNKYPNLARTERLFNNVNRPGIEGIDFVICPICHKKLKEINSDHLIDIHNINIATFNKMFPGFCRTSKKTSQNKNAFKKMTLEISQKLKKSHTIDGYIAKYGESEGRVRFSQSKLRKSISHRLEGYIEKYGDEEGKKRYHAANKKKRMDLQTFQERSGIEEGTRRYLHFIERLSRSRRMFEGDQRQQYEKYVRKVRKFSTISIKKYGLAGFEGRSRKTHLDHKYPIIKGFLESIDPVIIGSIYNLQMLSSYENCHKKIKESISLIELLEKVRTDSFYQNLFKVLSSI